MSFRDGRRVPIPGWQVILGVALLLALTVGLFGLALWVQRSLDGPGPYPWMLFGR